MKFSFASHEINRPGDGWLAAGLSALPGWRPLVGKVIRCRKTHRKTMGKPWASHGKMWISPRILGISMGIYLRDSIKTLLWRVAFNQRGAYERLEMKVNHGIEMDKPHNYGIPMKHVRMGRGFPHLSTGDLGPQIKPQAKDRRIHQTSWVISGESLVDGLVLHSHQYNLSRLFSLIQSDVWFSDDLKLV